MNYFEDFGLFGNLVLFVLLRNLMFFFFSLIHLPPIFSWESSMANHLTMFLKTGQDSSSRYSHNKWMSCFFFFHGRQGLFRKIGICLWCFSAIKVNELSWSMPPWIGRHRNRSFNDFQVISGSFSGCFEQIQVHDFYFVIFFRIWTTFPKSTNPSAICFFFFKAKSFSEFAAHFWKRRTIDHPNERFSEKKTTKPRCVVYCGHHLWTSLNDFPNSKQKPYYGHKWHSYVICCCRPRCVVFCHGGRWQHGHHQHFMRSPWRPEPHASGMIHHKKGRILKCGIMLYSVPAKKT